MTRELGGNLISLLARLKHLANNSHLKPEQLYTEEEIECLIKEVDERIEEIVDSYDK